MDSTHERPSKRKKTNTKEIFSSPLDQQLTLALRNVSRATKKAKAFEIQHLVRKLRLVKEGKPIQKKEASAIDPAKLEADLSSFKSINVENLSKKILYTRLKRQSPETVTHSIFEELQDSDRPIQLDRIENKISSQKTSADLIKQTVSKLLLHLRPDSIEQIDPKTTKKSSSTTSQKSPADGRASAKQPRARNGSSEQDDSEDDDEELLGDELDEAVARELAGLEAGSTGESSTDAEQSRRNHSDDDDEPSDSQSDRSDESQSLSGYSSESSSLQPAPTKKAKLTKLSTATKLGTRASSSTFLPALNVGYTLGDSDASDLEIDDLAVDKMERERGRKNRRGQQARRAIWEKKYGKSAKHLVKLKQKRSDHPGIEKHESRDPHRRSETSTNRFKKAEKGTISLTGSNSEPIASTTKKSAAAAETKMHPSWIAKQNQIKSLSEVKPAGKKIVFD
ncbi:hypothetical protein PGTUg99_015633 [Puccinia graminis f. sp. tritici]|uniref:Bud22 domain-containing protein n=1 Tax=Puccinia graminis f. sp. tritici TaxID=56615 RepID=A0A5B0LL93_PUCGR|nr:hypothetical protein PGTUg99_015633 [Puccinia graminis f. sp. tritici]